MTNSGYKNNSGKVNIKNTIKILKWYYGETKNYKKLKELIENLYNARNKINHTDELIFKSFGHFDESKKTLKEIEELIMQIVNN